MTDADLQAIKARLAAATPGPWTSDGICVLALYEGYETFMVEVSYGRRPDDAEFIAHAPTTIAALVAEVERLRAAYPPVDVARLCVQHEMCARCGSGLNGDDECIKCEWDGKLFAVLNQAPPPVDRN